MVGSYHHTDGSQEIGRGVMLTNGADRFRDEISNSKSTRSADPWISNARAAQTQH